MHYDNRIGGGGKDADAGVLTLFVTGLESVAAATPDRFPALEKLLDRSRSHPLEMPAWHWLVRSAGADPGVLAPGPVSALGELEASNGRWLRVEPLGAEIERQGTFRLRAIDLQISRDEADALASAFRKAFAGDGVELVVATPVRWYLHVTAAGDVAAWHGFPEPPGPLAAGARPGPPEPGLRRLLSETEMLFHAHDVNVARRDRGAPVILGMHPWGGGTLPAGGRAPAPVGVAQRSPVVEEPMLAGLRRLGAIKRAGPAPVGDRANDATWAWPVPVEEGDAAALARVENEWAAPALRALQSGRLDGVRLVTARHHFKVTRPTSLRFWRRGRPLGDAW